MTSPEARMLLTSSCDIVCCGLSRCKHHENYFETWISVHDVVLWRSLHVSSSERPLMFFWHIHACISNATRWRMTAPWIPQLSSHSHMSSIRAVIQAKKNKNLLCSCGTAACCCDRNARHTCGTFASALALKMLFGILLC